MRIVENTPARLVLRDRTVWLSIICFAAAFLPLPFLSDVVAPWRLLGGFAPFFIFGLLTLRTSEVVFDKAARTCDINRFDMLRRKRTHLVFADIVDVRVEREPTEMDRRAALCRLSLVTDASALPLTAGYSGGPERFDAMRKAILGALSRDVASPADVDPIDALVQQGRTIDAVAAPRARDGPDMTAAVARVRQIQKERGFET
jgi:hypothetical protein